MNSTMDIETYEATRIGLQATLDAEKTSKARNKLGQFATPTELARDILAYARAHFQENQKINFLDPAIGTGSFYSALLKVFPSRQIASARGFEIDHHYGVPAKELWKNTSLEISLTDFTKARVQDPVELLICNPPYVRHHHIANEDKERLQTRSALSCGTAVGGLAGLYCYFLGISHQWLAPDGLAGWLIPSEFMDVNYGQALKQYLLERVTLLHIHRFDPNDVQFADALVSSAVVWFRNSPPPSKHRVHFTFGGSLAKPSVTKFVSSKELRLEKKWTRFPASNVRTAYSGPVISDLFQIRRGLATGDNSYFILDEAVTKELELPVECLKPILPSPRYLKDDEVKGDIDGLPIVDRRLFLLAPELAENEIKTRFPSLWKYLETGKAKGLHERYLCSHRKPWYSQEKRSPAPIYCTYLGRGDAKSGRPFRFILNSSQATITNVYLAMYPTAKLALVLEKQPDLIRQVWKELNQISAETLLGEGRVYGGGLHKLEPKELANVPLKSLEGVLFTAGNAQKRQNELFGSDLAAE